MFKIIERQMNSSEIYNRYGIRDKMKNISCFQIIMFHNFYFDSLNYFWINSTFLKFFVIQVIHFWRYRVIIIVYFWYAFLIAYHPYPIKIHAWTFSIYEQFKEKKNILTSIEYGKWYCPFISHIILISSGRPRIIHQKYF